MNIKSSLLSASFAAALALVSVSAAQAAGNSPTAKGLQAGKSVKVFSGPLVLYRSITSEDNNLVTVGSGFQAIDAPTTIVCPALNGCVLTAEQNVQVRGTTNSNQWAICTRVDGFDMNEPFCPFLGFVPNGSFGANSFAQHRHVAQGSHTVQTFLFTSFGADRSIYHINYAMYKGN